MGCLSFRICEPGEQSRKPALGGQRCLLSGLPRTPPLCCTGTPSLLRALAQHCDSHRMAGKNGRRAHPVKRHFPHPEGQSGIMVFLASPHPVCRPPEHSGKISTHHHRNLETRKPGQREPEFLGMERPWYSRKQRGKQGARGGRNSKARFPGFRHLCSSASRQHPAFCLPAADC